MPKVKVNDINMYYEIHGEGEPLVLIAGFSVDHTNWLPVINLFKQHFKVIVFDNRGAGQTDVPQHAYTIAQMADDVIKLCDALNIAKANFIGNSMGGFILQYLARHYADRVLSAVISNSTMSANCVFKLYIEAQLQFILAKAPLRSLIQASCCWCFSYNFLAEKNMLGPLIDLGINNPYPFTVTGYEGQLAAVSAFESIEWAHEIKVPTLVISGDQDLIFSAKSTKALADTIPNAAFYCFTTCGHLPMLEHSEEFTEVVTTWIKQGVLP